MVRRQDNSKKGVAALLVRNRVAQIYEDEIISEYVTYKVFAIAVIKTGFKPVVEVAKKLKGEGHNNFFFNLAGEVRDFYCA